ncbi:MAG: beta-ketoacyl-ACP synthase III [Planctomycetes bacterium]|nr:beta-ketoacyl-ACP synthase III [Planctomycetota bacterium]
MSTPVGKVYITGAASFLPNNPISNEEIEDLLGRISDRPSRLCKKILANNGIKSRYYALDSITGRSTHTNAQMTAEAVNELANSCDFDLKQLNVLACGTSSPDQLQPHHGSMVHGELKCPPCEVVGFAGICCSGVAALKYGSMNIMSGLAANAIVTGSERVSALTRAGHFQAEVEVKEEELKQTPAIAFSQDFLRWMLSDGAGAFLLQNEPAQGKMSYRLDWLELVSYANEMEACMYWGAQKQKDGTLRGWLDGEGEKDWVSHGYMNVGQDIKQLNPHIMPYTVRKTMEKIRQKRDVNANEIDWFLPHYSSEYFRDQVAENMRLAGVEIPFDKWFTNLTTKGNTGSASIYIMLDELMKSGRVKDGDRILCYVPESSRFSSAFFLLTATSAQSKD